LWSEYRNRREGLSGRIRSGRANGAIWHDLVFGFFIILRRFVLVCIILTLLIAVTLAIIILAVIALTAVIAIVLVTIVLVTIVLVILVALALSIALAFFIVFRLIFGIKRVISAVGVHNLG
jgi:hypothetical protein